MAAAAAAAEEAAPCLSAVSQQARGEQQYAPRGSAAGAAARGSSPIAVHYVARSSIERFLGASTEKLKRR